MTNQRHLNQVAASLMAEIHENGGTECAENPDLFFPDGQDMEMNTLQIRIAKTICERCPVLLRCTEYTLLENAPFGVWAGLTPLERRQMLNRKR
jgi:hypothetical protein